MKSEDRVLFYSAIGLFVGLYSFLQGLKWFKRKRLIEDIPTSEIRSMAMGLVEIFGEVVPAKNKLLRSPFTENDCVYYKYTIEELRGSKHRRWVTIKSGENGTHFYLQDNSGHVLVDPKGVEVNIPPDFGFQSGLGQDPPELIKQFLRLHNLSFEGFLGINKTMRYSEYYIVPGDKLYIMGTAGDNPFVEEAFAKIGIEDVMIQKGESNEIYYISDRPEKEILNQLKWKTIGGIFGGGFMTIGCLFVILLYLNLI